MNENSKQEGYRNLKIIHLI